MYTTTGNEWDGQEFHDGQLERFEETFPFDVVYRRSTIWKIELLPRVGGNADVNSVVEDDFPQINPDSTAEEP